VSRRYEAICLAFGAAECVSVDYNPVNYSHQRLSALSVKELKAYAYARQQEQAQAQAHRLPHLQPPPPSSPFTVAISISSLEHDGLARYGDAVDPDADLAAIHLLSQVVEPGGHLLLAVPVGGDLVRWNMHRVYGPLRLPLLLQNWTLLGAQGFDAKLLLQEPDAMAHHQPVFILENSPPAYLDTLQRLHQL
jgi:hypothetical protein